MGSAYCPDLCWTQDGITALTHAPNSYTFFTYGKVFLDRAPKDLSSNSHVRGKRMREAGLESTLQNNFPTIEHQDQAEWRHIMEFWNSQALSPWTQRPGYKALDNTCLYISSCCFPHLKFQIRTLLTKKKLFLLNFVLQNLERGALEFEKCM